MTYKIGKITVNGKEVEAFDIQVDWKPLAPDPDVLEQFTQFNQAMQRMRQEITIQFGIPPSAVGVPYDGQIIPTGPVVDGSIEPE